MKKLYFIFVLLFLPLEVFGQDTNTNLRHSFNQVLKNMPKGFTFLKSYSTEFYYSIRKPWYKIENKQTTTSFLIFEKPFNPFILVKNTYLRRNIEFTLVLSKGNIYWIGLSKRDSPDGIVGVLFDSNRQELATSYVNNRFYKGFYFKCTATGFYYFNLHFKDSQTYCAAAILALQTKKIKKL